MKILLLVPLLLAACTGGSPPPESAAKSAETGHPTVAAPQAAWQEIRQGALLIDVRTPAEFEQGHLKGAVNIPHDQIGEGVGKLGMEKDRKIVLYCRSGRRSGLAQQALQGLGYRSVLNAGGYEELRAAEPPPAR